MWNAVLVGIGWCFLSLFFFFKTQKKRKSKKVQYSETKKLRETTENLFEEEHTSKSTSIRKRTTKYSSQNVANITAPAPLPKKRHVHPDELDFEEVIQRYLTTKHSSVSSVFDYYSYFRAEFDCILKSIPRVHIALRDEKVLRGKEILTPFEKTARITKRTPKAKVANFVVVDTETTGIKTGGNDIIEVSAIKFENFVPVSMFTTLLKPRKSIPEDATRINGITDEMVQNAPKFSQIKSSLESFIGNHPIVAHNAEFDIKFLHVSGLCFKENAVFFDTLALSRTHIKEIDGTKLPSYKLGDVCRECCIHFDGKHRSSADALATGLLFIELVKSVFETENVYSIQFSSKSYISEREQKSNDSSTLLLDTKTEALNVATVPVIYPDNSVEDIPLSAKLLSTSLRCLRASGSNIYHTHFDCFLHWPEEEKRKFRGWGAILEEDAKAIGLQKCQYCENQDLPLRQAYMKKSYQEQMALVWEPYKTEIPISTFQITVKDQMYIAELHRLGEEISIDCEDEKKPMIVFGLTEYCPVPQKIREICRDDYNSYKMFILDGRENRQEYLVLKIGVYKRKLWSP